MLDIHKLMSDLSNHRPIFHSEEDFQHALKRQIRKAMPACEICLEWPYRGTPGNGYLDIYLSTPGIAIELKYRTKKLEREHDGEDFSLSKQEALPQWRYAFLKDLQRLERVVADRKAKVAFGILLTNDPRYWDSPRGENWKTTTDADFRLHEGRTLTGKLTWSEQASDGTMRTSEGKDQPIRLKGSYHLHWKDYSNLEKKNDRQLRNSTVYKKKSTPRYLGLSLQTKRTNHLFRYLAVSVK